MKSARHPATERRAIEKIGLPPPLFFEWGPLSGLGPGASLCPLSADESSLDSIMHTDRTGIRHRQDVHRWRPAGPPSSPPFSRSALIELRRHVQAGLGGRSMRDGSVASTADNAALANGFLFVSPARPRQKSQQSQRPPPAARF